MTDALAVFHGRGTHPLSPFLKPGFRHVFCAVRHGHYWAVIDAADGLPAVWVAGIDDLAGWYRGQGYTVVEVTGRRGVRVPLCIASCVGLTKAVVGIRSWALTPWQLHQHLTRRLT